MKGILQRADLTPDSGSLKNMPPQYDFLQNVRGYGGLISKRNGMRNITALTGGIMGIFDIWREGDPTSPDKIMVMAGDGSMQIYDWTEFTTVFSYTIADGGVLCQQSPDTNWWQLTPGNSVINVAGIAAPVTTRSTDLVIAQGELFGAVSGATTYRYYVDNRYPPVANAVQEYGAVSSDTVFSTLAFTSAAGLVFEVDTLERYRVGVNNAGELTITGI